MTFEQWMQLVEANIARMTGGLSSADLPDCCYADWYEDECSAKSAARKAIRYAQD
jgi:hypothetical protein